MPSNIVKEDIQERDWVLPRGKIHYKKDSKVFLVQLMHSIALTI